MTSFLNQSADFESGFQSGFKDWLTSTTKASSWLSSMSYETSRSTRQQKKYLSHRYIRFTKSDVFPQLPSEENWLEDSLVDLNEIPQEASEEGYVLPEQSTMQFAQDCSVCSPSNAVKHQMFSQCATAVLQSTFEIQTWMAEYCLLSNLVAHALVTRWRTECQGDVVHLNGKKF